MLSLFKKSTDAAKSETSTGVPLRMNDVDLVLTCFERTYRKVLTREFVEDVVRRTNSPSGADAW